MWSKRESTPEPVSPPAPSPPPETRSERASIGPSISIVGEVTGGEDLVILGRVEGKVSLPQHAVSVGRSARLTADVEAKVVSVEGEVRGHVRAAEQILIRKTATMLGDLKAPRVGLEDGCRFKGSVDMETSERPSPEGASRSGPGSASPGPAGRGSPAKPGGAEATRH